MTKLKRLLHFLFCDYGIWENTTVTTIYIDTNEKYTSEGQKRFCKICSKKQIRTL